MRERGANSLCFVARLVYHELTEASGRPRAGRQIEIWGIALAVKQANQRARRKDGETVTSYPYVLAEEK